MFIQNYYSHHPIAHEVNWSTYAFKRNEASTVIYLSFVVSHFILQNVPRGLENVIRVLGHDELKATNGSRLDYLISVVRHNLRMNHSPNISDVRDLFYKNKKHEELRPFSYQKRLSILNNSLEVNDKRIKELRKGDSILIIDDVTTTGATAKVYSELIKQRSGAKVYFLAINKAIKEAIGIDEAMMKEEFYSAMNDLEFSLIKRSELEKDFDELLRKHFYHYDKAFRKK